MTDPRIIETGEDMPAPADEAAPAKKGFFKRLRDGLSRSTKGMTTGVSAIFTKRRLDDDALEELEDLLIQSDLGVETSLKITEAIASTRYDKEIDEAEVRGVMADEIVKVLAPCQQPIRLDKGHKPHVILVVGVNGTGKTTTIGKLAKHMRQAGKSVVLGAGDTFRAAAIDQLKVWGERIGAPVVARDVGADAAGLAFDAIAKAQADNADVVMIDTAGRLHNKRELMQELEKVVRVIKKKDETAPHDVLLVLDATTGQNALTQVEVFRQAVGVTGLVMTKLDGTARGGILVAVSAKFGLPVHAIGVGEGEDDLQAFSATGFARAIAGLENGAESEAATGTGAR